METIGDRIKKIRKTKKLTQTQFGEKVNVKTSTVGGWENGFRNINDRSIKDICREFSVSEWYLRSGEGEMFVQNDIMLIEKIDDIMSGESEFRKNLIKAAINYTDEELLMLEKIINTLVIKKTD